MSSDTHFTPGVLAAHIGHGAQPHHVQKLMKRGAFPFIRAGRFRFIAKDDIPKVREALLAAGYIRAENAEVATC